MSRALDETTVNGVLAGWTACRIFGPRVNVDQPPPSENPDAPASYLVWQLEYDPDRQRRLTFGGTKYAVFDVAIGIFTEKDLGDPTTHADALETLFEQAGTIDTGTSRYQFLAADAELGDEEEIDGGFIGRRLGIPVHRFKEPS